MHESIEYKITKFDISSLFLNINEDTKTLY